MNPAQLIGYHSEWNLVCPGGFDYQRMAQERGQLCWDRVKSISGIDIELDFDHPLLNPVPSFVDMLLRAHRLRFGREKPFVVLVAEKDTLDKVPENINVVQFLNRMEGVGAALTCPEELEKQGDHVTYLGQAATVIFLDMNNEVLLKIGQKRDIEPLLTGIKKGIVVNPRGLTPLGAKGVFETVTGELRSFLTPCTVKHTPWTRQFFPRKTTGPQGESISDLVEWVAGTDPLDPEDNPAESGEFYFVMPYEDDPSLNFAYFVYDGVPDWTGSWRPGREAEVTARAAGIREGFVEAASAIWEVVGGSGTPAERQRLFRDVLRVDPDFVDSFRESTFPGGAGHARPPGRWPAPVPHGAPGRRTSRRKPCWARSKPWCSPAPTTSACCASASPARNSRPVTSSSISSR